MKFSDLTKSIKLITIEEKLVSPELLNAQYNPDRFESYTQCADGLEITKSPHADFLANFQGLNVRESRYYKMHKLYGRDDKWIFAKIDKFMQLHYSIMTDGVKENVIVLEKPLVENDYNDKYEIFEGHHRTASCLVNKIRVPIVVCSFTKNE